jgi:hypothetical protein
MVLLPALRVPLLLLLLLPTYRCAADGVCLLAAWHVHEGRVVRLPAQAGAGAHAGVQSVDEDRSV